MEGGARVAGQAGSRDFLKAIGSLDLTSSTGSFGTTHHFERTITDISYLLPAATLRCGSN